MNLENNRPFLTAFLVGVLLACLAFQCISSLVRESPVIDEPGTIAKGITHLGVGREARLSFLLGDHHPPLACMISAMPILFMKGIKYPVNNEEWLRIGSWEFTSYFLFDLNMERAESIVYRCRLVTVFFSLMLGLIVFHFGREFYGTKSGLFALFIYSFSPTVIAYSRYSVLTVCSTFFILLSICAFYEFLKMGSWRSLVFAGLALGLAQLTKYTALLLIPCFILFLAIKITRERGHGGIFRHFLKLLLIFVIAYIVVWAGYGFGTGSLSDIKKTEPFIKNFDKDWYFPDASRLTQGTFRDGKVPLVAYVRGIWELSQHARFGHPAFLMGETSMYGWWYYYIITFLIKTPIPVLSLLFLRLCLYGKVRRKGVNEDYVLLIPIFLILFLSMMSRQNIGLRHIFLIYPLLHVFLSSLVTVRFGKLALKRAFHTLLVALSAWYVYGTISIWPHYLAYFNELIGGPKNGYKYLVGANLDWGQDLKGLKEYMVDNHIEKALVSLHGWVGLIGYYGIECENLHDHVSRFRDQQDIPVRGVLAISASRRAFMCSLEREQYGWLDKYEPVDNVGHSILIYKIE